MSSDIRQYIETCGSCATYSTKQRHESPIITTIPPRPWQKLAADLCSWGGKTHLVVYCYHSNFFEVDELTSQTTGEVIAKLKVHFARYGVPETLVTDNGPQFSSAEFQSFKTSWNFQHETSSPGHPQANGAAEAAVKIVKRIFRKCKASGQDPYKALLLQRNTPTEGMNTSPSQRIFGRRTRTMLPTSNKNLEQCQRNAAEEAKNKEQRRTRTANKGDLKPLIEGDTVRMQPFDKTKEWAEGKVKERTTSRSYEVQKDGRTYRRNRQHLRLTLPSTHSQPPMNKNQRTPTTLNPTPMSNSDDNQGPDVMNQPEEKEPSEQPAAAGILRTRSGRVVRKPACFRDG